MVRRFKSALAIVQRTTPHPILAGDGILRPMPDDPHPLKQALIDLAEWHDRWRGEPGLESLVEAVRRAWISYVAANCEVPSGEGRLAEVIPMRPWGSDYAASPLRRPSPRPQVAGQMR